MPAMKFPCGLEPGLGRFCTLSEEEEIAQSVRMILMTRRGERPFRPKFGSRLSQYAFERMDTTLRTQIRQEVVSALQIWEPRIWNIRVEPAPDRRDGELTVSVSYEILRSGVSARLTVPLDIP